jgi:hypothetical protein
VSQFSLHPSPLVVLLSSQVSSQPISPSPQRHAMITVLNCMAPGPVIPPALLTESETVGGMQNNPAVTGSEVSSTQVPVPQSASVVQAPTAGSVVQYLPSAEGEPVLDMTGSKQGF